MKTNLISKAVVMLAVVMASVMNFSASASNPTSVCEERRDDRRADNR